MAQIIMSTPHDAERGKYAKSDQIYFKIRKFDNAVFGVRLKHPATNEPPTAAQQAAQDLFTTVAAKVKTALADASQRAQYKADWKKQKKYKTLTSYIFHVKYEEETAQP
jgi:hypothetical protein